MSSPRAAGAPPRHPNSSAFLLAQIGALAAAKFGQLLGPLDLTPPHSGILFAIAGRPGSSQQTLGTHLAIFPSRLVALLDDLEQRGLVERRDTPEDRRTYALHLTRSGARVVESIRAIALEHDAAIAEGLDAKERAELHRLLEKIAERQGLVPGVHPGYSRMGPLAQDAATPEGARPPATPAGRGSSQRAAAAKPRTRAPRRP